MTRTRLGGLGRAPSGLHVCSRMAGNSRGSTGRVMGCCTAVKLLVCALVMAGRSTERLGSLAELGAILGGGGGMENREQVTVTHSHIKEIYT